MKDIEEFEVTEESSPIEEFAVEGEQPQQAAQGPSMVDQAKDVGEAALGVSQDIGMAVADNFGGKYLLSGINAGLDYAQDKYFGNEPKPIGDYFDANKANYTANALQRRKDAGAETMVGDAISFMAPGAIVAKAGMAIKATKVAKVLRPLTRFLNPGATRALTKSAYAGVNAAGDTAIGVLQNKALVAQDISTTEMDAVDTLDMFALSFGARGLMGLIPNKKGAGTVLRQNVDNELADESVAQNILSRSKTKSTTLYNDHIDEMVAKGVPKEVAHKEAVEIFTENGGRKLDVIENPEVFKSNFKASKDKMGSDMSQAYDNVDKALGRVPLKTNNLVANLEDMLSKKNPDSVVYRENVIDPAKKVLTKELYNADGSLKEISLSKLWNIEKGLKADTTLNFEGKKAVATTLRNLRNQYTDDFISSTNKYADELGSEVDKITYLEKDVQISLSEAKRKLGSISDDVVENTIANPGNVPSKVDPTQVYRDNIDTLSTELERLANQKEKLMGSLKKSRPGLAQEVVEETDDYVMTKAIDFKNPAEIAKSIKGLSQKYHRYSNLEDVIDSMELPKNADTSFVENVRGALGSIKNAGAYVIGGPMGVALNTGYTVGKPIIKKAVKDAALANPQQFAAKAEKVAQFLDKVDSLPNDPFMQGLFKKFNQELMSDEIPPETIIKKISSYNAKGTLYANPLMKTRESVENSLEEIFLIADEVAPDLIEPLSKALEMDEDAPMELGAIVDSLSKIPELKRFFKPGLGFDGRVFDPKDKAMLQTQLDSFDATSAMPTADYRKLSQDLQNMGTIPNFDELEIKYGAK